MKINSPVLTRLAGWLLVKGLRAIYLTVRRDSEVADPDTIAYDPDVEGRYLFCTWHESIVMPLFHAKPHHMTALVSGHRDGSYLAESMNHLNVTPVRGSSGKGGVKGLRDALTIARDHHITVTPDGPRGPRREMKEGIVFLAAKSGNPIVPMAFRVSSCWKIRGKWTDLVIPKPFSRVTLLLDEPIRVPKRPGREGIERLTVEVQRRMDAVYRRAEGTPGRDAGADTTGAVGDRTGAVGDRTGNAAPDRTNAADESGPASDRSSSAA